MEIRERREGQTEEKQETGNEEEEEKQLPNE